MSATRPFSAEERRESLVVAGRRTRDEGSPWQVQGYRTLRYEATVRAAEAERDRLAGVLREVRVQADHLGLDAIVARINRALAEDDARGEGA